MATLRRDHHRHEAGPAGRPRHRWPGTWREVLPGVDAARHYRGAWLRRDVLAGATVTAYLIPQVMAYAEVAGLPAVTGLWAIIGPLLVYALLGSSTSLSVGPESTTALMTAAMVAPLAGGAIGSGYPRLAMLTAIVVGLVCLLGWLARLGFLADLLSRPVLTGYMAGIAVLMMVSQLGKVTGMRVPGDTSLDKASYLGSHLGAVNVPTLLVATGMLLAMIAWRRWVPTWPGPLLGMLAAAGVVAVFGLSRHGVAVIGEVPRTLPVPTWPDWSGVDPWSLLPAALGLAVVGYSDNVLTARALATDEDREVDANQEFLALGAANIAAGVMQGFPVSSSASRSVIAKTMNASTQLYSVVTAAMVVGTVLFLGPVLASFPAAALGALVMYAAVRLIDLAELRRIRRFRVSELVLALATTVSVLVFDVLSGIGVAVALSLLDLLRRIADPHDAVLGYVPGIAGMHDIDDYPQTRQVPGLVVYRYDAPLCFANAHNFRVRALGAVAEAQQATVEGRPGEPVRWFLLNAEANTEVDLTSVDALESLRAELAAQGVQVALTRVKQDVRDQLNAAGFLQRLGPDRVFMTLPTAVEGYRRWYQDQFSVPPPGFDALPTPIADPPTDAPRQA
ncbi:MAG: SulP family inorganic anion transporter [Austwickia sp.]|nr:SulP family inorganic anion transporter [Austwickia sp.]